MFETRFTLFHRYIVTVRYCSTLNYSWVKTSLLDGRMLRCFNCRPLKFLHNFPLFFSIIPQSSNPWKTQHGFTLNDVGWKSAKWSNCSLLKFIVVGDTRWGHTVPSFQLFPAQTRIISRTFLFLSFSFSLGTIETRTRKAKRWERRSSGKQGIAR